LQKHNEGASIYTADFQPWKLVAYVAFDSEAKALRFEKYIKIDSGHASAQKRFW